MDRWKRSSSSGNVQRSATTGTNRLARMRDSLLGRPSLDTSRPADIPAHSEQATSSRYHEERDSRQSRPSSGVGEGSWRRATEPFESVRNSFFRSRKSSNASSIPPASRQARPPSRSSVDQSSRFSREYAPSEIDHPQDIRDRSISPPFNFQHVTHTSRDHLSALEKVDETQLKAEFWSVSGYPRPRRSTSEHRGEDSPEKRYATYSSSKASSFMRPTPSSSVTSSRERLRITTPIGAPHSIDETIFNELVDTSFSPEEVLGPLSRDSPQLPARQDSVDILPPNRPWLLQRNPGSFDSASSGDSDGPTEQLFRSAPETPDRGTPLDTVLEEQEPAHPVAPSKPPPEKMLPPLPPPDLPLPPVPDQRPSVESSSSKSTEKELAQPKPQHIASQHTAERLVPVEKSSVGPVLVQSGIPADEKPIELNSKVAETTTQQEPAAVQTFADNKATAPNSDIGAATNEKPNAVEKSVDGKDVAPSSNIETTTNELPANIEKLAQADTTTPLNRPVPDEAQETPEISQKKLVQPIEPPAEESAAEKRELDASSPLASPSESTTSPPTSSSAAELGAIKKILRRSLPTSGPSSSVASLRSMFESSKTPPNEKTATRVSSRKASQVATPPNEPTVTKEIEAKPTQNSVFVPEPLAANPLTPVQTEENVLAQDYVTPSADKTSSTKEISQATEPSPVQQKASVVESAPVENSQPTKEAVITKTTMPAEELASVEQSSFVKEPSSVEESMSAEQPQAANEPTPAKEISSAKEQSIAETPPDKPEPLVAEKLEEPELVGEKFEMAPEYVADTFKPPPVVVIPSSEPDHVDTTSTQSTRPVTPLNEATTSRQSTEKKTPNTPPSAKVPSSRSTPKSRVTSTFSSSLSDDTWEDEIDYIYEQEAESSCDFDWKGVSANRDSLSSDGGARSSTNSRSLQAPFSPTSQPSDLRRKLHTTNLVTRSSGERPKEHRRGSSVGHQGFLAARQKSSDVVPTRAGNGERMTTPQNPGPTSSPQASPSNKTSADPERSPKRHSNLYHDFIKQNSIMDSIQSSSPRNGIVQFPSATGVFPDYLSDAGSNRNSLVDSSQPVSPSEGFSIRSIFSKDKAKRSSTASNSSFQDIFLYGRKPKPTSPREPVISSPIMDSRQQAPTPQPSQRSGTPNGFTTIPPPPPPSNHRSSPSISRMQTPGDRAATPLNGQRAPKRPSTPNRLSRLMQSSESWI